MTEYRARVIIGPFWLMLAGLAIAWYAFGCAPQWECTGRRSTGECNARRKS